MSFKPQCIHFLLCALAAVLAGCSSVDCPLNNVVRCHYAIEYSGTSTVTDTLSITAGDTTLLNRGILLRTFSLPMGYAQTIDTLRIHHHSPMAQAVDTLIVTHTNTPHFVSLDCATAIFHTITDVDLRVHPHVDGLFDIDSVAILRNTVDYEQLSNIRLYIRCN